MWGKTFLKISHLFNMKCGYPPSGIFLFFDLNTFIHPTNSVFLFFFFRFYYLRGVYLDSACALSKCLIVKALDPLKLELQALCETPDKGGWEPSSGRSVGAQLPSAAPSLHPLPSVFLMYTQAAEGWSSALRLSFLKSRDRYVKGASLTLLSFSCGQMNL